MVQAGEGMAENQEKLLRAAPGVQQRRRDSGSSRCETSLHHT